MAVLHASGRPVTRRAVIAGVGATDFSVDSGRTEAVLAVQATLAALADANILPSSVDGLITFAADTTPEVVVQRNIGAQGLNYTGRSQYGGTDHCSTILQAKLAVEAGVASRVVCYRAFNERSGQRYGQGYGRGFGGTSAPNAETDLFAMTVPFGLLNAAGWVAMYAQRYMWLTGTTSRDLANVSVAARAHAATNPAARFYGRPITVDDHQASKLIVEPLRLFDCCLETDGGVAIVVTTEDIARNAGSDYVHIAGVASGSGVDQQMMATYSRDDSVMFDEIDRVARLVWERSGLEPDDIDVAILYDHFTPMVLAQLEAYGFCGRGEAKDFVADGNIHLGGKLPVNTHGGQIGEAYIHGMNGIAEGVRQTRGTAVNQIAGARTVLVSAPPGTPSSGLILTSAAT